MTKRFVEDLTLWYASVWKDVAYRYPQLGADLSKDWIRLTRLIDARGIRCLTLDLPALGKHLDRCLNERQYNPSGLPGSCRVSKGVVIPKFLRGLYLLIFDHTGSLRKDYDVEAVFLLRQILYGAKRVELDCSPEDVSATVAEFLSVDRDLPKPSPFWEGEAADWEAFRASSRGFLRDYAHKCLQGVGDEGIVSAVDTIRHSTAAQRLFNLIEDVPARGVFARREVPESEPVQVSLAGCLPDTNQPGEWSSSTEPCKWGGALGEITQAERIGLVLLTVMDKISAAVSLTLGPYRFEEWDFKHGPGVTSNIPLGEDRYEFHNWCDRLESEFPLASCAFSSDSHWASQSLHLEGHWPGGRAMIAVEPLSLLMAVPKDFDKPRLIAAEAAEMMWCQQNVKHYIYSRVKRTWIDRYIRFTDQTRNQVLAKRGSRGWRSLCTVDLSAASDRVSCLCVGNMFRANYGLLRALRASRTRYLLVEDHGLVELNKYSTMGNATTFPVQSLIFLTAALTACAVADRIEPKQLTIETLKRRYVGKVSVFGDDIIVPDCAVGLLKQLLEILDFKLNTKKSFTGPCAGFRESCGVDAYMGYDVTPVYWHRPFEEDIPESYASTVATANNLYKRFMLNAAEQVRSTITKWRTPLVPCGSGTFGFSSFVSPGVPLRFKRRWNQTLQRSEVRVARLLTRVKRTPRPKGKEDVALFQYFSEHPSPYTLWTQGFALARPEIIIRHQWVSTDEYSDDHCGPSWWSGLRGAGFSQKCV